MSLITTLGILLFAGFIIVQVVSFFNGDMVIVGGLILMIFLMVYGVYNMYCDIAEGRS